MIKEHKNEIKEYKAEIKELKDFLLLWGSQSLSTLGSSMTSYALLLWVYQQKNSTMGVAVLAVCTYLPAILLGFFAGTFVDRKNKKNILLFCDCIAAGGTISIYLLMSMGLLKVWHIYIINSLLSITNAFQTPADTVLVSAIVPKKYYLKIGGLQSISSSAVGIITPALAATILSFYGINPIFFIDISSFVIAFVSLLCLIQLPDSLIQASKQKLNHSYIKDCKAGFHFLRSHKALLHLILFFTLINLVAYIGGGGITTTVTAMILSRIPDGQNVLGMFSAAVGLGTLVGGFLVTFSKPPKSKVNVIFISCGLSFLICDLALGLSETPAVWIIANFIGNLPLAMLSSNQGVIMRTMVPIEMQGRVFSARDTLQYCTIPLGYLLGGLLADYIFEPLMRSESIIKNIFTILVGQGNGSGIAVMFIFTGITGSFISIAALFDKTLRTLDK